MGYSTDVSIVIGSPVIHSAHPKFAPSYVGDNEDDYNLMWEDNPDLNGVEINHFELQTQWAGDHFTGKTKLYYGIVLHIDDFQTVLHFDMLNELKDLVEKKFRLLNIGPNMKAQVHVCVERG